MKPILIKVLQWLIDYLQKKEADPPKTEPAIHPVDEVTKDRLTEERLKKNYIK